MSRRKRRYERRQKQRAERRLHALKQFDDFSRVISHKALYEAARQAAKGVSWKVSVQRYLLNILVNTDLLHNELLSGKDIRKGFISFDINERGKVRHIRSVYFSERVVQKSLCLNALYPILTYNLIFDNGASQKNKGTKFATDRLIKHLRQHIRRFGVSGYILLIDYKSYFDNIDHQMLKKYYRRYIKDPQLLTLTDLFVDAFGDKGLGLGSETSQIHAISYPNKIDHYIKEIERIKGYGRYMDDSYIIHENKKALEGILSRIQKLCDELGIRLNPKKTYITDLKHGFSFLKTRFHFTETGKIIKKPCRKSITYERRKLKKQGKLVAAGLMSAKQVKTSFASWAGSMKDRNANKTVFNMTKLLRKVLKDEKKRNPGRN